MGTPTDEEDRREVYKVSARLYGRCGSNLELRGILFLFGTSPFPFLGISVHSPAAAA